MYYDGCYSGQYFLGTFHRGLTFYTVNDSEMRGFETYLKIYFRGGSDEQIWAAIAATSSPCMIIMTSPRPRLAKRRRRPKAAWCRRSPARTRRP